MTTTRKINKITSEAASAFGRLGGLAVSKKHGPDYMAKLGRKGAAVRWKGHVKKTKK